MPAPLLVNLEQVDLERIEYPVEEIRKYVPQRYEMEMLSAVVHLDAEAQTAVGYHDVGHDEFWVRGHIPGRPLMPGVMMIEAAAQLCTFLYKKVTGDPPDVFMGFGGLEKTKFRAPVQPGQRLVLMARMIDRRSRIWVFDAQGVVDGRLVFEAQITGMRV